MVAQQVDQGPHEIGDEERDVAAGHVCALDGFGQRLQSRPQPLQRTAALLLVVGDDHGWRQVWQGLSGGGDDHDRGDDGRKQADDTLQHRLGAESQKGL